MKKLVIILCLFAFHSSVAQSTSDVFHNITSEIKNYKINTSQPPQDKLTSRIRQLRNLRGGFNIQEAINFKIGEEKSKGNISDSLATEMSKFQDSDGAQKLENAVIWIYREEFTYKEIGQLVKFYRTSAGSKLAERFPYIMLKSLVAGESIFTMK